MASSSSSHEAEQFFFNLMTEAALVILAEEENAQMSEPRRRHAPINQDRQAAHDRLVFDYFAEHPVYNDDQFKLQFRMSRQLFLRIADDMAKTNQFFTLQSDARMKKGFTTLKKCTAALRQLAYGTSSDSWDKYLRMSERTSRECLYKFSKSMIRLYSKRYLRRPTRRDVEKLYAAHEKRHRFPGMLGSINCMHWAWRNCHNKWRGQFARGDHGHPTIMLEAVASQDLWVWHAFFGVAGSNNDLNILDRSDIFTDIILGTAPDTSFTISRVDYKYGYYLTDGIYPDYATIVKSIPYPEDGKMKNFAKCQESARKDVERLFGVLRQRWHIMQNPARAFTPKRLRYIMYACILLHNMILEDEGRAICEYDPNDVDDNVEPVDATKQESNRLALHNPDTHLHLRADLIEHIWNFDHDIHGDE